MGVGGRTEGAVFVADGYSCESGCTAGFVFAEYWGGSVAAVESSDGV